MGISAPTLLNLDHDTDVHWETPTPDPPLKVPFPTWCGWDTTICGKPSSADSWLHCKAGRGTLHPGVTQWLPVGKSLLKGQRWRRWEAPQTPETGEATCDTLCLSPAWFPYPLQPFSLCTLLTAAPLSYTIFLKHQGIFWDVAQRPEGSVPKAGWCTNSNPRSITNWECQTLHSDEDEFYWLTGFLSAPSQDVKVVKPQGLVMCREKNNPSLGQGENLPEVLLNSNKARATEVSIWVKPGANPLSLQLFWLTKFLVNVFLIW